MYILRNKGPQKFSTDPPVCCLLSLWNDPYPLKHGFCETNCIFFLYAVFSKDTELRGDFFIPLVGCIHTWCTFRRGALGYSRNRKTEETFIQNCKTANKIGQNRKPYTKLYTQIGPNRKKKYRKSQKPHWVPKPKNC